MKKKKKDSYALTSSDISCIIDVLSILCSVELDGVSESQMALNDVYCESVLRKLSNAEADFDGNEVKVISAALTLASMILSGYYDFGDDIYRICADHRFEINRLEPVISEIYSQHAGK